MDKEELEKIINLDERINSKIKQLDNWRHTVEGVRGIDYTQDKVKTGPTSQIENTVLKIMELEEEIQKDINRLVDMKNHARNKINKVEGVNGTVLEMRYLECIGWKEIADRLGYVERQVHRRHGQGLLEIKKD